MKEAVREGGTNYDANSERGDHYEGDSLLITLNINNLGRIHECNIESISMGESHRANHENEEPIRLESDGRRSRLEIAEHDQRDEHETRETDAEQDQLVVPAGRRPSDETGNGSAKQIE